MGTEIKGQRRFFAESGASFLYFEANVARSYTDGTREVVLIGQPENSYPRVPKPLPGLADFPGHVKSRIDLIPKGSAWEFSSLADASRSLVAASVSTRSTENSWPPGSFVAVSSDGPTYYSQTKTHWVIWNPGTDNGSWEFQFMRASLSEDLDERTRAEDMRPAAVKPVTRAIPGGNNKREFVGSSGVIFNYEGEIESRVRDGVERAWLYPRHEPSASGYTFKVNVVEPSDYERPENFTPKDLTEVVATPKTGRASVNALPGLEAARLAELDRAGVVYSTRGWVPCGNLDPVWPEGSFAIGIEKPFVLSELYTQNDSLVIRVRSGKPFGWNSGDQSAVLCRLSRYLDETSRELRRSAPRKPADPRPFPRDPMILAWGAAALLLVRRGGKEASRIGRALAAVLVVSCAAEAVMGRFAPGEIALGPAIQHAVSLGLFGWMISTEGRRRGAALIGVLGGLMQGYLFGWAPIAWGDFLGGGQGPGVGALINIGFTVSDALPYHLPLINLWAMTFVAAAATAWGVRDQRLKRALYAFLPVGVSAPLALVPGILFMGYRVISFGVASAPARIVLAAAISGILAEVGPSIHERLRRRVKPA